jgi:hypothetical protein
VDFLPARDLSDAELEAEREAEAASLRGRRSCSCMVDGQERTFHTSYSMVRTAALSGSAVRQR